MCYCFVCDVPAPCKYWGQGLLNDDHCHATDKEAKWKKLRQAFKCKSMPASYSEKHLDDIARGNRRMAAAHHPRTSEAPLPDSPPLDVVYPTNPSARQVRVENLPYHMDREDLPGLFYHAGSVVLSEVFYDRETGQSLGCGLVTMNTVEEAEKAVELYHHSELCGRLVTVSKAAATGGRAEETPSPRRSVSSMFMLFVNNLSPEVNGYELKRLFSEFGEVVHAKVIYHHTGARWESKEFGVVTMATREGLKDAIRGLNKVVWRGRELRVG
uniref:RRM domain-containing protein n=1 Tax=Triticum urartu TaxID=4572 RepID=A0A8R7PM95_TRIUA